MSDYDRSAIQKADYVDRLLDKGFRGGEADDKATTWNELLMRNGIEPPESRFELSTLDEVCLLYRWSGWRGARPDEVVLGGDDE